MKVEITVLNIDANISVTALSQLYSKVGIGYEYLYWCGSRHDQLVRI
jgi:hypothetical protein